MKLVVVAVLCTLVLGLGSCATSFPKQKNSEDCLVLIRTVVSDINNNRPDYRRYMFYLSDRRSYVEVDNRKTTFLPIVIRKAGVILTRLHSEVQTNSGFVGPATDWDTDFDLPYKAGKVVIASFAFVKAVNPDPNRPNSFISYNDFKKLSPEEVATLQEEASDLKALDSWEF